METYWEARTGRHISYDPSRPFNGPIGSGRAVNRAMDKLMYLISVCESFTALQARHDSNVTDSDESKQGNGDIKREACSVS